MMLAAHLQSAACDEIDGESGTAGAQASHHCSHSLADSDGSSTDGEGGESLSFLYQHSQTMQNQMAAYPQDTDAVQDLTETTSDDAQTSSEEQRPRGQLVFNADFEASNLGAVKRSPDGLEYEIQIRPDTLNPRHRLWFHFRVHNCLAGQQALFSITNFSKTRSLFRCGMTPVVRSTSRPAWHRLPSRNMYYYRSTKGKGSYVLSFVFQFDREADEYDFAYSIPHTYTELQRDLTWLECMGMPYYRRQLLCRTPQLRRVDVLTISEPLLPEPSEVPFGGGAGTSVRRGLGGAASQRRRVVALTGRVHPGETPASHFMQGLISFLMSGDPEAAQLRSRITWLIVPMLNPDGVFQGNYRTDAGGIDLNRMWATCSKDREPGVFHSLEVLQRYYHDPAYTLDVFVDVHGHSNSRFSFMFCNPPREGEPPSQMDHITRLPKLLDATMPGFSLAACTLDEDPYKAGCARRVAGTLLPSTLCYTLELSFFCAPNVQEFRLEGSSNFVSSSAQEAPAAVHFANTVEGYYEMAHQFALAFLTMPGTTYGQGAAGAAR